MSLTRELNRTEKWNAVYKGVHYEISKRFIGRPGDAMYPEHPAWCYYIFLNEDQVPVELRPRFFLTPDANAKPWAKYKWDSSAFYGLDSWHSGMTFYGTERHDESFNVVKAGCDYDHIWDQDAGWPYTVENLDRDARATIDELRERFPELLGRCNYTGTWVPFAELIEWGDGYICPVGIAARDASKVVAHAPH